MMSLRKCEPNVPVHSFVGGDRMGEVGDGRRRGGILGKGSRGETTKEWRGEKESGVGRGLGVLGKGSRGETTTLFVLHLRLFYSIVLLLTVANSVTNGCK